MKVEKNIAAADALMAVFGMKRVTKPRPEMPTEHAEQRVMVAWMEARGWLVTATAAGVDMGPTQRNRWAQAGGKRGVPDLLSFTPVRGFYGVAVEMKRCKGGTVSPEQKRWISWLTACGWLAIVARGADDGIRQIEAALKETT